MDPGRLRALARTAMPFTVAAVLVATLAPSDWIDAAPGLPGAASHALVFAAFGASLALTYATSTAARRSPRRLLLMALLAIWLLASTTELLQGRVPGREPEIADWLADVAGGVLGFLSAGPAIRIALRRGEP